MRHQTTLIQRSLAVATVIVVPLLAGSFVRSTTLAHPGSPVAMHAIPSQVNTVAADGAAEMAPNAIPLPSTGYRQVPSPGIIADESEALEWVQGRLLPGRGISEAVVRLTTYDEFMASMMGAKVNHGVPDIPNASDPVWVVGILADGGAPGNILFGHGDMTYDGVFVGLDAGRSRMVGYGFVGTDHAEMSLLRNLRSQALPIRPASVTVAEPTNN